MCEAKTSSKNIGNCSSIMAHIQTVDIVDRRHLSDDLLIPEPDTRLIGKLIVSVTFNTNMLFWRL